MTNRTEVGSAPPVEASTRAEQTGRRHALGRTSARRSRVPSWRIPWGGLRVLIGQVIIVAVVLSTWQVAADLGWMNAGFTSDPKAIGAALSEYYSSGRIWAPTASTLEAAAIGFVIGSTAGAACGYLLGLNPRIDRVFGPLMVPLNSVPRIALAPIFILWFGLSMTSKVILAVSFVFFVLAFNARAAVKDVDPELLTMAKVIGYNRRQVTFKIVFPSSVPAVFAGLRLAITYSLLGVVASEMIAAKEGLGQEIVYFSSTFEIASVFAILVELAVIATVINWVAERIERNLLRWQEP